MYKVNWSVVVSGTISIPNASNPDDARRQVQQLLGQGISISAGLHQPPGITIKAEMQIESDIGLTAPTPGLVRKITRQ
jgi:hypothetical protein